MSEEIELIDFLKSIKKELNKLVTRKNFNFSVSEDIKSLWANEVEKKFDGIIDSIDIKEDDLKMRGLFGKQLELKWKIWEAVRKSGRTEKILDFINSLLSSLSAIIPELHMIKEFKDMMHLSLI